MRAKQILRGKVMRKWIRNIFVAITIIFFLAVAGFGFLLENGTSTPHPNPPDEYGTAIWRSESPEIWFKVEEGKQGTKKEGASIYKGGIAGEEGEKPCKVMVDGMRFYVLECSEDVKQIDDEKAIISGYYHYFPLRYHSGKLKPERLIFDASEKTEDYRKYQRVEFVRYSYEREEPETDFRDRKIESSYAAAAGQRGK